MHDLAAKQEITELYARYAHHYDHGRAEEFGDLFTETAIFLPGPGREPVTGREAIAALVRAAGTPNGMRHLVSTAMVDLGAGGTATGAAYVQAVTADERAVRLVTLGRYTDEFRHEDGAWRFHHHRYEPFTGTELRGAVLAEP